MSEIDRILHKLDEDLHWRGPTGRPQKILCIDREDAELLLGYVIMILESVRLHGGKENNAEGLGGQVARSVPNDPDYASNADNISQPEAGDNSAAEDGGDEGERLIP